MLTFLTTKKMDPALVQRIHESLGGRKRAEVSSRSRPALVAALRLALIVLLVGGVGGYLTVQQKKANRLEIERHQLLTLIESEVSSLTQADREMISFVEDWSKRAAAEYEVDVMTPSMRAQGALDETLQRSTVYLRGPVDELASGDRIMQVASRSFKDAFLLCLQSPPAAEKEKDLLEKVYAIYRSGPSLDELLPHVERYQAALVGMPLLEPEWTLQVRRVKRLKDFMRMKKAFDKAPLAAAKKAAHAELLLLVLDEPKEAGVPSEFDGAAAHYVRVSIVEIATKKVLLRQRLFVDPAWISEKRRHRHALGLVGCRLAQDLRKAVLGSPTLEEEE